MSSDLSKLLAACECAIYRYERCPHPNIDGALNPELSKFHVESLCMAMYDDIKKEVDKIKSG